MLPSFNLKTYLLGLLSFMLVIQVNAQESQADLGQINVPNPSTYIENYEYDAASDLYYYNVKVGEYDISYPIILTPDEYQELILKEDLKSYYKSKIDAARYAEKTARVLGINSIALIFKSLK